MPLASIAGEVTFQQKGKDSVVYAIQSNADVIKQNADGSLTPNPLTWSLVKTKGETTTEIFTTAGVIAEGLTPKLKVTDNGTIIPVEGSLLALTVFPSYTSIHLLFYKGDSLVARKNIRLVKDGEQGPAGETGPTGPPGPAGEPGLTGERGDIGPSYYPAGVWDAQTSYKRTDKAVPVVECEGQYYALEKDGTYTGLNPMDDYRQNGSNATWQLFDKLKYAFIEVLFAKFGKLASAVFNGDYMLSQYGVNGNGVPSDAYQNFKPRFKNTVFMRSSTPPATPSGGTWDDPASTSGGWSETIPGGSATLYASSREYILFGDDSPWSTPVQMMDTSVFNVLYSSYSSPDAPQGHPNTNAQWGNTPSTGVTHIATSSLVNGVWTEWEVEKLVEERFSPNVLVDWFTGAGWFANRNFKFDADGSIDIIGKVKTSAGNKRIVIDPESNSINMFNSDGRLASSMYFSEGEDGWDNDQGIIKLMTYLSDGTITRRTFITSDKIISEEPTGFKAEIAPFEIEVSGGGTIGSEIPYVRMGLWKPYVNGVQVQAPVANIYSNCWPDYSKAVSGGVYKNSSGYLMVK